LRDDSSIPNLFRTFLMKGYWILSQVFRIYYGDHVIFILDSVYALYYI
jgi:hypothetical protein